MSSLLSSKQLLKIYNIDSAQDDEGNDIRGTAYEFQDYAYRLASNLNDLEHLIIYMKLAKKYPRFMLDKAYESIADSKEDNKGRLFMWKFKQVRAQIQKNRDVNDYSYNHIKKKMRDLRNNYSESIILKNNKVENNPIIQFLPRCSSIFSKKIKKILILGLSSTLLTSMFENEDTFVFGIDISKNLTNENKKQFKSKKRRKFITKDFLENSYKLNQFDLIIIQNYWEIIPLEIENDYLKECQRILSSNGKIILNIKKGEKDFQNWIKVKKDNGEQIFFQKKSHKENLENRFKKLGFEKGIEYIISDYLVYEFNRNL